jgi:hypothetical protein
MPAIGLHWRSLFVARTLLALAFVAPALASLIGCSPAASSEPAETFRPPRVSVDGQKGKRPGCVVIMSSGSTEPDPNGPGETDPEFSEVSATKRTIFLNRHGGVYSYGADDAWNNRASVVGSKATVAPYEKGDAAWAKLVACVRDELSRWDVVVTDANPGQVVHIEAVVGGGPQALGVGSGVGGLAPMSPTCAVVENAVVFVFSKQFADLTAECEMVTHELGHALGLDHEYLCEDPMTYLDGCGHKQFQDTAAPCGESVARSCQCGAKQSSVQHLTQVLGLAGNDPPPPPPPQDGGPPPPQDSGPPPPQDSGPPPPPQDSGPPPPVDTTPPVVALGAPSDSATVPGSTKLDVSATASDDVAVAQVVLLWESDGKLTKFDCAAMPQGHTCSVSGNTRTWRLNVGTGTRTWSVQATDTSSNTTVSEKRTLTLQGAPADGGADGGGPLGGAPTVTLDQPAAGASFSPGALIAVRATATDDGQVTEVWLKWSSPNGDSVYQMSNLGGASWGVDLDLDPSAQPGPRTLRVTAWDDQGQPASAKDVVIQIQ